MINFTDTARVKVEDLLTKDDHKDMSLRVQIMGRGAGGFQYSMRFVPEGEATESDELISFDSFSVIVDKESLENLKGATVDFKEDSYQRGFAIDNPNPVWKDAVAQEVQDLLDAKINPGLASHGGFVALLDYKDDVAYIGFGGGCQGCGMIDVTMKNGVEATILDAIPQVKQVLDTTDHRSGEKPYYESREGAKSALS
jgi:Fe/S biogenesis protein NfuA